MHQINVFFAEMVLGGAIAHLFEATSKEHSVNNFQEFFDFFTSSDKFIANCFY
ncbi:hypothetical protein H6G74_02240 [Nostoc spongiaeforme FACHB-130]|uniref:Uncharacterized protein n=1 Tax=Nostoc spongiaeforme FACHB-130 TaxID=1357510 RepID=A0ABR8FQ14_9NOSO|nr:hypothetical protein [Nostoc spongiaeforme]MBD2593148.1 hypothetical protein [Nostoc spongiaeforme FACHB-130]